MHSHFVYSVAAKVFYKNQPVLDFLKDILVDMQGGGRNDRGGRGGGRGGRGGGGRRQDRAVPGGVEVPQWLDDHQKMKFLKEIKGQAKLISRTNLSMALLLTFRPENSCDPPSLSTAV